MWWKPIVGLLVRYTLVYGGLVAAIGYGAAVWFAFGPEFVGLLLLVIGVATVVLAFTGTTGTGTAAFAVEPASGISIDTLAYLNPPVGNNAVKALFFGLGLAVFGGALLVVAG